MSKRFKKLSHTIYECKYHIVCCPKYRHRIFKDEIKEAGYPLNASELSLIL